MYLGQSPSEFNVPRGVTLGPAPSPGNDAPLDLSFFDSPPDEPQTIEISLAPRDVKTQSAGNFFSAGAVALIAAAVAGIVFMLKR